MAKKLLTTQYEFNALNKSITLSGNIAKERLLLITNLNTGDIIYNFGDPDAGANDVVFIPSLDKTQLSLKYDTTAMSPTDDLQIFIEKEETEFAPGQSFLDPVSKIRVSTPENLIDTDFEYGLQATRWETAKLVNNIPTFYTKNANAPVTVVSVTIASNSKQVTVVTEPSHELIPGAPFEISGLTLNRFEGSFLVKTVISANTFTYEAAVSATPSQAASPRIETVFTAINPGAFYTGSNISVSKIDTNGANPSVLTVTTPFPHGFKLNNEFYFLNTVAFSKTNFNASTAVDVTDTISVTKSILSTTNGSDTTNYLAKTVVLTNWISSNTKYFQSTNVASATINTTFSAAVATSQTVVTVTNKTGVRVGQYITSTDLDIGPNGRNVVTAVSTTNNNITLKYPTVGPIANGTAVSFVDDSIDITHGFTSDTLQFGHVLQQQSNTLPGGLTDNTPYVVHAFGTNQLRFYTETATGRKTIAGNYKEIASATGTTTNTINLSNDATLGNCFNLTGNSFANNDGILYDVAPFSFTTSTASVIITALPTSQASITTQKTVQINAHAFLTGQRVLYKVTAGSTAIGGLNANSTYYIQNAGTNNIRFFDDYRLITTSNTTTANGYVNPTTEIIRWDNHGFTNGDIVAYNVLKLGVAPIGSSYNGIGGLAANTNTLYWVKVVDVNTFSLHTANTLTDANRVNLTSSGTIGQSVHLFLRGVIQISSAGTTTANAHQLKASVSLGLGAENVYWVRDSVTTGQARFRLSATPAGTAISLQFIGKAGFVHQFTRGMNVNDSTVILQNHGFNQDDIVILDTAVIDQTVYPGSRALYGKPYFVQRIDANTFQLRNGLISAVPVAFAAGSYGFAVATATTNGFTFTRATQVDLTSAGSTTYGPNHILFGLNRIQVMKGVAGSASFSDDTIHTYSQTNGIANNDLFVLLGTGTVATGLTKSSNNYGNAGYLIYTATASTGGSNFKPNAVTFSTDAGGFAQPVYVCEVSQPALADSIYSLAHGFTNNTYVQYTNTGTGASVIGGLTNNSYYYVVSATANNFKLSSAPSGAPINLISFGSQNHNFILTSTSPTRDTIILPSNFSTGTRLVYSPGGGNTVIQRQLAGSTTTGNLASTFYTLINKGAATGGTRYRITQNGDNYNLTNITFTAGASTFTATFTASAGGQTPANLAQFDTIEVSGAPAAQSWFNDVFAVASVGTVTTNASGLATATVTLDVPTYKDKSTSLSTASATAREFINLTTAGTGIQSFNTESGVDGVYKINAATLDNSTSFTLSSPVQIDSTSKSFAFTDVNTAGRSIALADHRFTDGTAVQYVAGTSAIGGLANGATYFVIVVNKDVIRLANTVEDAQGLNAGLGLGRRISVNLTTQGSGTHTFTTASVYGERPSNDASVNAGTATLVSGDSFVAGIGTKFLTVFSPGEKFRVYTNNKLYEYEIDSVKSDTRLKLKSNIPLNYGVLGQGDESANAPTTEVVFTNAAFGIQTKVYPKSDAVAVHRPFDGGVDMVAGSQPRTRIIRQTKKYFRYQSGKGIQISLATNFNPPFDVDSLAWDAATSTVLVNTRRPHNFSTTNFSNIKLRVADAEVVSGYNPYNGVFNVNAVVDEFQFRYKPSGFTFTGNLELNSNIIENVSLEAFEEIQIGGVLSGAQLPVQTLGNGTIATTVVDDVDVVAGIIYLGSPVNRPITGIVSNLIGMPTSPSNPFANGNIVEFNRTTNNIIKGVSYYVVNTSAAGFNISNTLGGTAITLANINTAASETVASIASDVVNVSGTNDYLNNDLIQFNDTTSNIVSGQQYLVRDRTTSSFKLSNGNILTYSRTSGAVVLAEANVVYSGVSGKNSQASITGASWTTNVATLTYSGSYIFPVGSTINVQKVSPTGYNGVYTVSASGANTVSFALTTNPGAYVSGGIVSNPSIGVGATFTIARDNSGAIPTAVTKNGTVGNDTENLLIVTSNTGIIIGAGVSGTNIPLGTKVTEITGTVITISNPLTGAVNGTVTFDAVSLDDVGNYYVAGDVITIDAASIGNPGGTDVAITVGTIDTIQLADLASGSVPVGFAASPIPIIVSPKFSATATQVDASIAVSKSPTTTIARGFPKFNVTRYTDAGIRAGMFDSQNGFFFEFDGTNLNCVRRSSTQQIAGLSRTTKKSRRLEGTETRFTTQVAVGDNLVIRGQTYRVVFIENDTTLYFQPEYKGESLSNIIVTKTIDTRVPQSQWNIDPCDGSGKFGYLLDLSRIQMCYADYSWYGAGKIRFGFKDQNGEVKYTHEFIHNNSFTEAYFRSGNIPVRYEAYTENAPDFSPAIFHWGTSVIMDGRFDDDKAYLFTGDSKFLTFTNGGNSSITTANIVNTAPLPTGVTRVIEVAAAQATNLINGASISGTGLATGSVIVSSYRSGTNVRIVTSPQPVSIQTNQTYTIGDTGTLLFNLVNITAGNGIPLLSVRLAPSVDNGLTGPVGYRDIINRMQMNMASAGIITTHDLECKLVLNGILSNDDFGSLKPPSLAQLYRHSVGDTVTGGDVVFAFRATGGNYEKKQTAATTIDLADLTTLGNSILGGDGVFPNGPDVLTLTINPVEPSLISGAAPLNVSARITWKESQA